MSSSSNLVQCPQCHHEFPLNDALLASINREAQAGIEARVKAERDKAESEAAEKIKAAAERAAEDQRKADQEAKTRLEQSVAAAIKLEQERQANEAKLLADREAAQQKSITDLMDKLTAAQKQNEELATKQRLAEIEARQKANEDAQKRFDEQAKVLEQKLQQDAELKSKGLEVQLESLRKQLEEANRRANQGSMQNQGAALEASFEEQLRTAFPRDGVSDVPTGTKGADVILDVVSETGAACGRILFETKYTAKWHEDWLPKLREDMHRVGAMVGVIVSQAMPKDIKSSGLKDGMWVSDFSSAMTLVRTLRWGLQEAALQKRITAEADNASALLYEFVTGPDFRNRVQSIMQTYRAMRTVLDKERTAMQKIWKKREAQLDLLTGHTMHVITHLETRTGRELDGDAFDALEDAAAEIDVDIDGLELDDLPALPGQTVTDENKQRFLSALGEAGGKSGNIRLRESLGWNEALYEAVKATLLAEGAIEVGQGRGGSVKLAGLV
jgi:hypothetical protein